MKILFGLLISIFTANAAFDPAAVLRLTTQLRTFSKVDAPAKTDLKQLFKAIRYNHELLEHPVGTAQILAGLKEQLDDDTLSWWDAHVDEVIERLAAWNYDLAQALKSVTQEREGTVKAGWRSNLDAIAVGLILLPIEFIMGGHSSALNGAFALGKLPWARDVLAVRDLVKRAHAERCAGALSATAVPNP